MTVPDTPIVVVTSQHAASRDRLPLPVYLYVAVIAGIGIAGSLTLAMVQVPLVPWLSLAMSPSYTFALLLFLGEMRPLFIARYDGDTDQVGVSTTFAVALVLTGPLVLALAVQLAATIVDDVHRRRRGITMLFNAGQYLITLLAARGVFALAAGVPFDSPLESLHAGQLAPALLSAAAYFAVNNCSVAGVRSLLSGQNIVDLVREDIRVQGMASSTLLGLAPVAAVTADYSLYMLPLLLLPLLGVQHNASIAARRQHEALHDGLTGLPNRSMFRIRAERAIEQAGTSGRSLAVMLLDLDHFKEVNDTLGHHVGDGLLREVSSRITQILTPGTTIARLGGDEFAVLVPDIDETAHVAAHVAELADDILRVLREPVMAAGVRIGVQASVGIALFPTHGTTIDTLLQRADVALYRAKTNRGETQVYREDIDEHTVGRLSLLGDLHGAVENDEFTVLYQPQVDTASGEIVAVEALMRWEHPTRGTISPDVFIPLAESTGLIGAMSASVVAMALQAIADVRRAGHDLSVAVNISARLLSDLQLPTRVAGLLLDAAVPASQLTIEVTESTISADPTRAMQVLRDLRDLGVRLAIDDFGTGYSSLSYLRRLQPDELKVDRSFVMHMCHDENSRVIVQSTVELGHGLGLSVVAEGVEDRQTYDALVELRCERIQGYLVARPMTAAALYAWLEAQRRVHI